MNHTAEPVMFEPLIKHLDNQTMKRGQIIFNAVAFFVALAVLMLGIYIVFDRLLKVPLDQRRFWYGSAGFSAMIVILLGGGAIANFTKRRLGDWPTGLMIFAYCISVWLLPLGIWGMVLLFSERKKRQHNQDLPRTGETLRPPAVILATVVLGVLSVFAVLTLALLTKFDNWINWLHVAHATVLVASFIGLIFLPRMQTIYYLASVALGIMVIKGIIFITDPHIYVPPLPPNSPATRILSCLFVFALGVLFWRFSFGRPSQEFFKFRSPKNSPQPSQ